MCCLTNSIVNTYISFFAFFSIEVFSIRISVWSYNFILLETDFSSSLFSHLTELPICIFLRLYWFSSYSGFFGSQFFMKSLNFYLFAAYVLIHVHGGVWTHVCVGVPLCICGSQRITLRSHFLFPPDWHGSVLFCCAAYSCLSGWLPCLTLPYRYRTTSVTAVCITYNFKKRLIWVLRSTLPGLHTWCLSESSPQTMSSFL